MANETRVLIGVPLPPNYVANTKTIAQIETWHTLGGVETYYPATRGPEIGQTKIVQFALYAKPRATHILFMDYDVIPKPNTLKRLLLDDKDIVSGAYLNAYDEKLLWCLSKEEPFMGMEYNDIPNNMFKAKTICNGMMLVRTEVFEKIGWPYFKNEYNEGGLAKGHDIFFCEKVRKAGYDLWVDPKVKCEHIKSVGLLAIAKNYIKGKKQ